MPLAAGTSADAVSPPPRPPAGVQAAPPWLAPPIRRRQVDIQWLLVTMAMTGSALVFFGWRGMYQVLVAGSAAVASHLLVALVVHLIVPRRQFDSLLHVLTLGLLTGLVMPLYSQPVHALLAGAMIGVTSHFIGRTHRLRIHPVALAIVALWLLPGLTVRWNLLYVPPTGSQQISAVLVPRHIIVGDVTDASARPAYQPWWQIDRHETHQSIARHEPYALMLRNQRELLVSPRMLVNMMTSGELPRVEELLLGATPGQIGGTSCGLIILLGMLLMYHRMSWWLAAVVALAAALITLIVMPVAASGQEQWTVVFWRLTDLRPAVSVTYLAYMLLASPLLLIILVLAPLTAPLSSVGRVIYAMLLGSVFVLAQWWLAVPSAALLSLLVASAVSRPLDALQPSPFR